MVDTDIAVLAPHKEEPKSKLTEGIKNIVR